MKTRSNSKSHATPVASKKTAKQPKKHKAADFISAYKKYFVAPPATPDNFRIYDLSDETGISYSSHT